MSKYSKFSAFTTANARMKSSIYIFILTIHFVHGFLPRTPPPGHWQTKTHFDITNTGILQAVSEYIYETKNTSATSPSFALNAFFGTDYNGMARMFETVRHVRTAVADTQENKRNLGYVHCNADQIKHAHSSLISCRSKLLERKEDLTELRRQLGECLYTIQSFYSNTNWVEMYGPKPYLDFGIKGKQLMTIANPEEDTCKDVPNIDKDCKDNMLVQNKLTSGYHHGRGNVKPPRSLGSKTGKCSHGGPTDTSRRLPAKCGINKDTTIERLSPHYHLHDDAYLAAVAATKHFLIDKDTGILQQLGNETFDLLFHITQRRQTSLSFVVDYSGSMGQEIASVKEKIIQIVTSTLGSANEPVNYVLSLFNDPENLNNATAFSSGTDMINAISNVKVGGGGDCPELAAAGILKAIELSLVDSTILVFTDADAKDASKMSEVQTTALSKQIKITTLRTGQCRTKKRYFDSAYRNQRDTNFFEIIAATTGGRVYDTNKADIGNVLDEVIEDLFPTSEVILEHFTWNREDNQTRAVYVDKSIQVLKIVIKGASRKDEIDFIYPNGTKETFSTPTASRIFTDKNDLIMSIQKLSPGMYNLLRPNIVHIDYEVNITAQSPIEVDGETVEENHNGSSISVEGSPIVGNSTSIFVNS
ncbi:von Willebrand factor A domain-containing protein 7-like [Mytilus edulis]|uniref:von Willebrand factor A domain-containing protein 7-like n=1 Tax=Mytilus edulis TaxID=6550 RepID=UPI0039EF5F95